MPGLLPDMQLLPDIIGISFFVGSTGLNTPESRHILWSDFSWLASALGVEINPWKVKVIRNYH